MRATRSAAAAFFVTAVFVACLPGIASDARATTPALEPVADHASAGHQLVLHSLTLIGVRYRFGGESPETGLDCSGLVRHVFREVLDFALPRRSEEMSRAGTPVPVDRLQPGDLVFFNTLKRAFSHVGIYIGGNRFVHAPSSGGYVRVESIGTKYWKRRFNGARRLAPEGTAVALPAVHETIDAERPSGSTAPRPTTITASQPAVAREAVARPGAAREAVARPGAAREAVARAGAAREAVAPGAGVRSLLDTIYAY